MPPEKYRQQVAIDRYIIHLNYKQIMSDAPLDMKSMSRLQILKDPSLKIPLQIPVSVTSHATNFQVFQPPHRAKKKCYICWPGQKEKN